MKHKIVLTKIQSAHNLSLLYQKQDELGILSVNILKQKNRIEYNFLQKDLRQKMPITCETYLGGTCIEISNGNDSNKSSEKSLIFFMKNCPKWDTLLLWNCQESLQPRVREIYAKNYDWIDYVCKIPGKPEFCITYQKSFEYFLEIKNLKNESITLMRLYTPIERVICIKEFVFGIFENQNCNNVFIADASSTENNSFQKHMTTDYDLMNYDDILFNHMGDNFIFNGYSYHDDNICYKSMNVKNLEFTPKKSYEHLFKTIGTNVSYQATQKNGLGWKVNDSYFCYSKNELYLVNNFGLQNEILKFRVKNCTSLRKILLDEEGKEQP